MFNSKMSLFYLILLSFAMINISLALEEKANKLEAKQGLLQDIQALEPTKIDVQPTNTNEAMRVANQYQTISNNVKLQGNTLGVTNQSIFNVTVISKFKAIIYDIQSLSQNLVDLVMPNGVPQSPDAAKVDVITNKLNSQQKSLTNFIQLPPNQPQVPFNPDKYDRPKEDNALPIYK